MNDFSAGAGCPCGHDAHAHSLAQHVHMANTNREVFAVESSSSPQELPESDERDLVDNLD